MLECALALVSDILVMLLSLCIFSLNKNVFCIISISSHTSGPLKLIYSWCSLCVSLRVSVRVRGYSVSCYRGSLLLVSMLVRADVNLACCACRKSSRDAESGVCSRHRDELIEM